MTCAAILLSLRSVSVIFGLGGCPSGLFLSVCRRRGRARRSAPCYAAAERMRRRTAASLPSWWRHRTSARSGRAAPVPTGRASRGTNREMAKKGRFYINDERVVTKLRLKNDYKNILTPEQLKHILSSDVNKAIELYKLAPIGQKSTIVEIIKQSKFNGEDIDYNLLRELTKLSGVDLVNIEDVTKIEIKE